uniref:protein MLP2-like isoform X22 n=1 Tax=Styela clava TaxID=7725 RepID=UPI00193984F5|nr:protein MLP2-like isoform X22 [Styela clava]
MGCAGSKGTSTVPQNTAPAGKNGTATKPSKNVEPAAEPKPKPAEEAAASKPEDQAKPESSTGEVEAPKESEQTATQAQEPEKPSESSQIERKSEQPKKMQTPQKDEESVESDRSKGEDNVPKTLLEDAQEILTKSTPEADTFMRNDEPQSGTDIEIKTQDSQSTVHDADALVDSDDSKNKQRADAQKRVDVQAVTNNVETKVEQDINVAAVEEMLEETIISNEESYTQWLSEIQDEAVGDVEVHSDKDEQSANTNSLTETLNIENTIPDNQPVENEQIISEEKQQTISADHTSEVKTLDDDKEPITTLQSDNNNEAHDNQASCLDKHVDESAIEINNSLEEDNGVSKPLVNQQFEIGETITTISENINDQVEKIKEENTDLLQEHESEKNAKAKSTSDDLTNADQQKDIAAEIPEKKSEIDDFQSTQSDYGKSVTLQDDIDDSSTLRKHEAAICTADTDESGISETPKEIDSLVDGSVAEQDHNMEFQSENNKQSDNDQAIVSGNIFKINDHTEKVNDSSLEVDIRDEQILSTEQVKDEETIKSVSENIDDPVGKLEDKNTNVIKEDESEQNEQTQSVSIESFDTSQRTPDLAVDTSETKSDNLLPQLAEGAYGESKTFIDSNTVDALLSQDTDNNQPSEKSENQSSQQVVETNLLKDGSVDDKVDKTSKIHDVAIKANEEDLNSEQVTKNKDLDSEGNSVVAQKTENDDIIKSLSEDINVAEEKLKDINTDKLQEHQTEQAESISIEKNNTKQETEAETLDKADANSTDLSDPKSETFEQIKNIVNSNKIKVDISGEADVIQTSEEPQTHLSLHDSQSILSTNGFLSEKVGEVDEKLKDSQAGVTTDENTLLSSNDGQVSPITHLVNENPETEEQSSQLSQIDGTETVNAEPGSFSSEQPQSNSIEKNDTNQETDSAEETLEKPDANSTDLSDPKSETFEQIKDIVDSNKINVDSTNEADVIQTLEEAQTQLSQPDNQNILSTNGFISEKESSPIEQIHNIEPALVPEDIEPILKNEEDNIDSPKAVDSEIHTAEDVGNNENIQLATTNNEVVDSEQKDVPLNKETSIMQSPELTSPKKSESLDETTQKTEADTESQDIEQNVITEQGTIGKDSNDGEHETNISGPTTQESVHSTHTDLQDGSQQQVEEQNATQSHSGKEEQNCPRCDGEELLSSVRSESIPVTNAQVCDINNLEDTLPTRSTGAVGNQESDNEDDDSYPDDEIQQRANTESDEGDKQSYTPNNIDSHQKQEEPNKKQQVDGGAWKFYSLLALKLKQSFSIRVYNAEDNSTNEQKFESNKKSIIAEANDESQAQVEEHNDKTLASETDQSLQRRVNDKFISPRQKTLSSSSEEPTSAPEPAVEEKPEEASTEQASEQATAEAEPAAAEEPSAPPADEPAADAGAGGGE